MLLHRHDHWLSHSSLAPALAKACEVAREMGCSSKESRHGRASSHIYLRHQSVYILCTVQIALDVKVQVQVLLKILEAKSFTVNDLAASVVCKKSC